MWTGFIQNSQYHPNFFVPLVPRQFLMNDDITVSACYGTLKSGFEKLKWQSNSSNDGYLESPCYAISETNDFEAHQIDNGKSGLKKILKFLLTILCSMWTTTTKCKSKDYWYCRFKSCMFNMF